MICEEILILISELGICDSHSVEFSYVQLGGKFINLIMSGITFEPFEEIRPCYKFSPDLLKLKYIWQKDDVC